MSKVLPYYQMWPDEFDLSENIKTMSLPQIGLYILCLNCQWRYGSIPDSPEQVSVLVSGRYADVAEAWPMVRKCFDPCPDQAGHLMNAQLEEQRQRALAKSGQASAAGKRSAELRLKQRQQPAEDAEILPNLIPALTELPVKRPKPPRPAEDLAYDAVDGCARFQREYPGEMSDLAVQLWISAINTTSDEKLFFKNLDLHKRSRKWREEGGRFIPTAKNYISEGTWRYKPAKEPTNDPYTDIRESESNKS